MIEENDRLLAPKEIDNLLKMQEFLLRSFNQSTEWVGKKNVTNSRDHCYAATLAATAAQGYATITDLLAKNRKDGPK